MSELLDWFCAIGAVFWGNFRSAEQAGRARELQISSVGARRARREAAGALCQLFFPPLGSGAEHSLVREDPFAAGRAGPWVS